MRNCRRILGVLSSGVASTLVILALIRPGLPQAAPGGLQTITAGRPLEVAASLIEGKYAKPITYEEPICLWAGEVRPRANVRGLYQKDRSFSLPIDLRHDRTSSLDIALLSKVLDAYHRQTDGPRFRISTSRWGFHILPVQARDATGRFVQVMPLLDSVITVPEASRTGSEHFAAVCAAVTKSAGMQIVPNAPWMDQFFAWDGVAPPILMTDKDKEQASFAWGASQMSAREALISLIELSATTLSWKLLCSADPEDWNCVLSLMPIQQIVGYHDGKPLTKSLTYDRCKRCPR